MKKRAFTLVEIMIVVAILALLVTVAIPSLLSARKSANDAAAKSTLRTLSTAAETYSIIHGGLYPASVGELQQTIASVANYCADCVGTSTTVQGYQYSCLMSAGGYSFAASPVTIGTSGSVTYTVITGGVLTPLGSGSPGVAAVTSSPPVPSPPSPSYSPVM